MTRVAPCRFLHISTDEVYGETLQGETCEDAPLCPSSPYAASKAAADHLIAAWARTYELTYNLVRPSNCYGTGQYPEKLIPKAVRYAVMNKLFPVHGNGKQTRYWLDVEDCATAILTVLDHGTPNATYNVGGNTEASVNDILKAIGTSDQWGHIRPGMDHRYHVNDEALRALGWVPQGDFWRDLPGLVEAERNTLRW
jgi:dTDP-glucose 4,6-dehydratase